MSRDISPLPWRVAQTEGHVDDILDANGNHAMCHGHDYDEYGTISLADAAFIVRAVNAHDRLVAALKIADELLERNGIERPGIRATLAAVEAQDV